MSDLASLSKENVEEIQALMAEITAKNHQIFEAQTAIERDRKQVALLSRILAKYSPCPTCNRRGSIYADFDEERHNGVDKCCHTCWGTGKNPK